MGSGSSTARRIALAALVALTMVAFAANSVLTRMALAPELIDAMRFASLRIASGAVTLWAILVLRDGLTRPPPGSRAMTLALTAYLIGFSFAYERLDAGVGALILFGVAQVTMIGWGLSAGERLAPRGWLGLALAIAGMVLILAPGAAAAPDPIGVGLMLIAGLGWGAYSLLGRRAGAPIPATAWNFLLCAPAILIADFALADSAPMRMEGVALALTSGVVATGLGYVVWYMVLPQLTATRAATAQLSVPAIAALGGALLIGEPITLLMLAAAALTLGGIGLVIAGKR